MGFLDTFKGKQYKAEAETLSRQIDNMQSMMTPEMQDAANLKNTIDALNQEATSLQATLEELNRQVEEKKKLLIVIDEELQVQDFGLYKPQFDFASSLDYADRLAAVRNKQKDMIKRGTAVTGNMGWTVNGNARQGKKMVTDTQKLLLRAFNVECDEAVAKVKYTNYDASLQRIYKSAETISKLGSIMKIEITPHYISSKVEELRLAFEYRQKKQEEKEEQQAARAAMREAAKLQKEIEEQRRKYEKEQTHYQSAYDKICQQLQSSPDDQYLIARKAELEAHLSDIEKSLQDIDYREANQRAGYVYIISNIGSFGENVYKIGMTRRLDPQDRVDELGDASVPFNFDVHAMIFSDDAPALEAALHREFENKKVNMVNHRREFFHVTLDEIKRVIQANFDKTVEFIDVPDAEQFRVSKKMRGEK